MPKTVTNRKKTDPRRSTKGRKSSGQYSVLNELHRMEPKPKVLKPRPRRGKGRTEADALRYIEPLIPQLQRGLSLKSAIDYNRLSASNVFKYQKKYQSVETEIRRARAFLTARSANTVFEAAMTDSNLALRVLKAKDEGWDETQKVEVTGEVKAQVNIADILTKMGYIGGEKNEVVFEGEETQDVPEDK